MSEYVCWCRASYCSRQVRPGSVLCAPHARVLAQVAPERLAGIMGIDPRGIECEPAEPETVARLEALDAAVSAIAIHERNADVNLYRLRANVLRAILARAEPPAVQARLIEDHPDTGAYGSQGRDR